MGVLRLPRIGKENNEPTTEWLLIYRLKILFLLVFLYSILFPFNCSTVSIILLLFVIAEITANPSTPDFRTSEALTVDNPPIATIGRFRPRSIISFSP